MSVHFDRVLQNVLCSQVGACMLITKPVQYPPGYIGSVTLFQSIDVEQKLPTRSQHSCLLICKVLAD